MPVLLLIVFIDIAGFGMVIPILPFYAEHFGASPFAVTALLASYSLMQFATAPVLGALSDRVGRRRVLMLSLLAAAAGYLVMATAGALLVLFLARGFAGAMAGNLAAAQAYIADVTAPEERARGMGLFGAAFGAGFVVGPAVGGLLAGGGEARAVDFSLPFLVAAATSLFAALLVFALLREPERPRPAETSPATAQHRWFGSLAAALRRPGLAGLVIVLLLVIFAFSGMEATFALWAERQLAWGPRDVGLLFAGASVIVVIVQGGLIGPLTKRLGEERVLVSGIAAMAVGFALLPLALTPAAAAAAMAFLAAGFALASPTLQSLISRRAEADRQGVTLGVSQSAASLGRILGPLEAGALFTAGGRSLPYYASAVILALVGIGVWLRRRRAMNAS